MPTLVVSDTHLGTRTNADLLRRAQRRERLFAELDGVDRLVLLGDVLELRDRPLADVLADVGPFFGELGEALAGRELVLTMGNHDHRLAAPVLDPRRLRGAELGLEQLAAPGSSGPAAALARRLGGGTKLTVAYPGLWLRPDVYATHGHYLDCHVTIPTFEALAVSLVQRLGGGVPGRNASPRDYEEALGPVYAFTYELAQSRRRASRSVFQGPSLKLWDRLNASGGRRGLEAKLIGGLLVPGAAAALNIAGLGPFRSTITAGAIRKAGLDAIGEVLRRLGIGADYVVFGHTHRPGPLAGFDEPGDWVTAAGTRLVNTGSWIYEPRLVGRSAADSPYWPGSYVIVPDEGPPEAKRLLEDTTRSDFD